MLKCFLAWEIFLSCRSIVKNYGEMFFLQFYFAVLPSKRRLASLENIISVENQCRVRAAKKIANTNDFWLYYIVTKYFFFRTHQ